MVLAGATLARAQTLQPNPQAALVQPPVVDSTAIEPFHYIIGRQRLQWFVDSTIGPETLTVGLFSAAIGTARDAPREYGGSWEGFGKRYGIRLTGVATGNAMEAGLGVLWGEDPRYARAYQQAFRGRIRNVLLMTFLAHGRDGQLVPAYSRYVATSGNNFLSNTWRADSEATTQSAMVRTVWGFVGLMGKNAFTEFWPDIQRKLHLRQHCLPEHGVRSN
jgi:hypothetical protein